MNKQTILAADKAKISKRSMTPEGYMEVEATLARTGIQEYHPSELGVFGTGDKMIKVYRPESEVFKEESLKTFALKPVTDDHPDYMVDVSNIGALKKGVVG